jgi:hypothetical protein
MASTRIERPTTVIKALIAPIPSETKTKIATAVQEVVNRIKNKHLS